AAREVEDSRRDLQPPAREMPADVNILLEEIRVVQHRRVALVVLVMPTGIKAGEETGGMVVKDIPARLLKRGVERLVRAGERRQGDAGQDFMQAGLHQAVVQADGQAVAQQLFHARGQVPLTVVQNFRRGGGKVWRREIGQDKHADTLADIGAKLLRSQL